MPGRPRDADGTVLRRYWTPAFQLGDLPPPDCPPIRVTILGENFVAFRDTNGRPGFLDELCCHRGASLALGRVEDCGIRCLYHGWKYAVDGTIMETPNLATPTFRQRVKHGAYPVREAGGLAWVYSAAGHRAAVPRVRLVRRRPRRAPRDRDDHGLQLDAGARGLDRLLACGRLAPGHARHDGAGPRSVGSFDFAGGPWDLDMPVPGRGGQGSPGEGAPARRPGSGPVTTTRRASRPRTPHSASTTPRSGT